MTTAERLRDICLSLPEAQWLPQGGHASLLVRKKVFGYFLDNHHGDGKVAVCFKAALGENRDLIALDPERFYLPAYIGHRGYFALRLDLGEIDWEEVETFARNSYRLTAPKKLVALLGG